MAARLAWCNVPTFPLTIRTRLKYIRKSANLACCFLGFSIHSGRHTFRRSAELGLLAAIFDLASDGLCYNDFAVQRFDALSGSYLEPEVASILRNLLEKKKSGDLSDFGLERGVGSLKVVLRHLKSDSAWTQEAELVKCGVRLQVVDDLLDYGNDIKNGELNFLRFGAKEEFLRDLIRWDLRSQFERSPHPLLLCCVIRRAKKKAVRWLERTETERALVSARG